MHREPEHIIRDETKCIFIYVCPCVFFSCLEEIRMKRRRFTFPNIISRAAPITSVVKSENNSTDDSEYLTTLLET